MRRRRGYIIRVQASKHSSEADEPLLPHVGSLGKLDPQFLLSLDFFSNASTCYVFIYLLC